MSSDPRVIFKHCGEALIRSLEPRLTPEFTDQLVRVGLDPRPGATLPPAFEFEKWLQILAVVAKHLSPDDLPAAHHRIGEMITDAYLENFIGKALKPVISLIGMRRALGRMRQNFRVANNYSEATVTDVAPGEVLLRVNETGLMAYFYRGILARGLLLTSPKDLSVEIHEVSSDGVTYLVRWTA